MQSLRRMAAGIIALSFSAIGCGSAPPMGNQDDLAAESAGEEQPLEEENEAAGETEIIVMNGSDPYFFWEPSTQKALRKLATMSLEASVRDDASEALLGSEKGRALLEHVVACALPAGETIRTADGTRFEGAAGLAAHWKSEPIGDRGSARWVTACLLQTLNGLGSHVPIRLTGSHPELGASVESTAFTVEDATMFGDIFNGGKPAAFACADTSLEDMVCDLSLSDYALLRICGQSPTCGVTFLGLCSMRCSYGDAGMPTCEAPGGDVYPEAISSYLKEMASLSLGDCPLKTMPGSDHE